ncbi:response regulator transcription factor [Salinicoccus roseus]|uniref:Transcriptional regulatory protein SrrA n=1 Tax=Salinicoccus roseus TaxID=45670 RepID=A0A0C2HDF9_9STAP|nr:response regulator transcription factor [Salinicoccus roseus]KIH71700.1 chemotaxis protein CheY [Salinicoccus roseus]MDB0579802.1 response regulator transcription factor [Salinicoccus roseus]RPE55097.1 two-component system alkaline phosphatase synthesis response regulator PhoP [Salinicoccus roseus]GGA60122.1 DNA-binding response regulator [Salinicoccus roseus]
MHKILVVDDEPSIVTLMKFNLEKAGYEVITAEDGRQGLDLSLTEKPDLIVLDLMLPGMDGMDVCKTLRQEKVDTPILMLTAKDEEFDKILGLELGADDYMTKPFSPREVVARVKAILRRTQVQQAPDDASSVIKLGALEIHTDTYDVYARGEQLVLTPKEYELLLYLSNHKNKVLSRDQLLNGVWDFHYDGDTRIVDVHISHLREKIEADPKRPAYIRTIRGFGYKLEVPAE